MYTTGPADLLCSIFATQINACKVLFEPKSWLKDSVTYDITAWALPYAYGLQSHAVKEIVPAAQQTAAKRQKL